MVSKDLINYMSVNFLAKTENVIFSRNVATTFLYYLNPTISFLNEIKTLVSEAVTNAIIHGYKENKEESVFLNIGYDMDNIYIEVIDSGVGIKDIKLAMEPMYTENEDEERSGLGFTIMECFCDELEVISKVSEGTTISITKKIKGDLNV